MTQTVENVVEAKGRVVVTATPTETIPLIVARMYQHGVGSVVVTTADGCLCGVLTKGDLLTRVILAGRRPEDTVVGDVMSTDLVTVSPKTLADDALLLMNRTHYRHLPVVVGDELKGLVAKGDLTRWQLHDHEGRISELVAYITRP